MTPYYEREGIVLYHADCREVLPLLSGIDAVVTDPPYGINASSMNLGCWKNSRLPKSDWDSQAPDLAAVLALGVPAVLWGGNYFPLPPSRCFLVWDKGAGFRGRDFAECEMAWCNFDANARIFTRDPLACGDYRNRIHKTQKPVPLIEWCIQQLPGNPQTILDAYAGSCTTGIAAWNLSLSAVLCEVSGDYCDAAANRIDKHISQGRLFKPEPVVETQRSMFGDDSP